MRCLIAIGFFMAGCLGVFLLSKLRRRQPEGDWWDEVDTTVEHRTRMFQGRDITEIGKVPDAET